MVGVRDPVEKDRSIVTPSDTHDTGVVPLLLLLVRSGDRLRDEDR